MLELYRNGAVGFIDWLDEAGRTYGRGAGVGRGRGVAHGRRGGCVSNEPMSMRPLNTRSKGQPRWSLKGGGLKFGSPASIAGLPGNSACVRVEPPLSCKGPSNGSVLI